ncbi:MAG TPA: hypothetical protein VGB14_07040 [Acidimicrobiales bacterium]
MLRLSPVVRSRAPAVARYVLWSVGAGAVVPVALLYALVTWTSPDGRPPFVDIVGRGEPFLVAAGLDIACLRDILAADRRRTSALVVEALTVGAVLTALFAITAWASLVEVELSGLPRSAGQERFATVWGTVAVVAGASLGILSAGLAAAKEER